MQSYPSGHTGNAFASGVFLALYLNAKLKAFSDYKTSFWKMMAVAAPIIGAMLIAGGLTIDHVSFYSLLPQLLTLSSLSQTATNLSPQNHHDQDIIFSVPIGIFCAMLAYRAHYLSLFSYQTNHIPLLRSETGESVLPPAPGAPAPVGQYVATKWPKPPVDGGLLSSVPNPPMTNVPEGAPTLSAGTANLPSGTRAPPNTRAVSGDGPTEDERMTLGVADGAVDDDATLNGDMDGTSDARPAVRAGGLRRGEQMV